MKSLSIVILKALLTSTCLVVISLSVFLIVLIFDMVSQEGIPPLLNIKASIALFTLILLLFIISMCFKSMLYASIDGRDSKISLIKRKSRVDDLSI